MDPFVFRTGRTAMSAEELLTVINESSDQDVLYHLDHRNDYAVWIKESLHDTKLANAVKKAYSKQELIDALSPTTEKEISTDALTANILFKEYVKGALLGFVVGLIVAIIIYNVI